MTDRRTSPQWPAARSGRGDPKTNNYHITRRRKMNALMLADLKIRPVQPLSKLLLQLHLCPSVHRPSLPLLLSFSFLSCCRCFGCQLLLRALDPLADRPRDLQTYVRSTIATADIHERFQPLHSGQKDNITHLRSIHSFKYDRNTVSRLPPSLHPRGEGEAVRPSFSSRRGSRRRFQNALASSTSPHRKLRT